MRIRVHQPPPAVSILGWLAILSVVVLVTSSSIDASRSVLGFGPSPGISVHPPQTPAIDHIVVVMLENHAFDNYFGGYCPAVGPNCPVAVNGTPSGLCVPLNPGLSNSSCVRPFNFTAANQTLTSTLPHGNVSSHTAWNNGSMNDFYLAEHSGLDPFGEYNGTTAPLFWDLAEEYGLSDSFFSSTQSYSLPNHWYLLAGQAPAASFSPILNSSYLAQADLTKSVEDLLLQNHSVSWDYYDYALPSYRTAQARTNPYGFGTFSYWNPQAAKRESYSRALAPHFVPNTRFFTDAKYGRLPDLSWVIPFSKQSDHPPNNVTQAESWVASVVDAVENSPEWNTTAVFLTWDDYGGFYDGVAPPSVGGVPLSFRVPLIVVSPYTAAGTVDHSMGYFESLLHYMETQFGLGCITPRDCNAPLPTAFFNFSMSPRPPMLFPTNPSAWTYPYAPPGSAPPPGSWRAPFEFTSDPNGTGVDVD